MDQSSGQLRLEDHLFVADGPFLSQSRPLRDASQFPFSPHLSWHVTDG